MVKRTGHSSIYAVYHVSNYPSRALWGERKRQLYLSDTLADCPKHFFAKIYDPKFFSHRLAQRWRPARPWFVEAESKAAAACREPWDPNFEAWKQPESEDLPGWEEWYFQNSERR